MNRARSRILGADLPGDLFVQRHAGHESGLRSAALQGGIGRKCRAKARRYATRNTGEPYAGDQSVTRGVGRIIAFDFANVLARISSLTSNGKHSISLAQLSVMTQEFDSINWYINCQPPTRSSSAGAGRGRLLATSTSPSCSAMEASEVRWAKASGERKTSQMRSRPLRSAMAWASMRHARRETALHKLAVGDDPTRVVIPRERSDRGISPG